MSYMCSYSTAELRGMKVQQYLDEKLSPGQIYVDATRTRAVAYHVVPGMKAPWFRIHKVPLKYWDAVVEPGLKHLAKSMGLCVTVSNKEHRRAGLVVEFYLTGNLDE